MFKNMIFSVLLLAISTAQAFPATDVEPQQKQLTCAEKRAWYGDIMNGTKEVYDAYKTKVNEAKLPSDVLAKLNMEHEKFENAIAEMLKLYRTESEKGDSISDSVVKLNFCTLNIQKYKELNVNLTVLAVNLKSNVLNVLAQSTVSKEVKDDQSKMLNKIVNYMYIADMTENLYKDVKTLVTEASIQTEKGNALETKYKFNKDGELMETAQKVEEDYKDILAENEDDKKLQDDIAKLADDTEIKAAEERALERVKEAEDNDDSGMSLGVGFGIATLAVMLLAILVGSVLVWIRSHSYSRFS